MTIVDDWIVLDTNAYIFGIREDPNFLAEIHGLPFRVLNATEALEELGKIH